MTTGSDRFIIAVVDDDRSVLGSLEDLLESADYEVRLFTSGAEFLDSDCLVHVHCVISDVDMPGMDGFEVLRLVQAARPGMPAIVITGYPERVERMPAVGGVKTHIFTKPFNGEDLLAALSHALPRVPR
jgi:FixJ family two-component response regulator